MKGRSTAIPAIAVAVALTGALVGGIAGAATPTTTTPTTVVAPTSAAAPTSIAPPTSSVPTTAAATTATPTTVAVATTAAATTVAVGSTTTVVATGISDGAIRAAKVGWSRFVARNFATPDAILDPCPLLPVAAATAAVSGLGLVPTDLPYGVALYRDATGAGIIGIACGADLSDPASPAGATLFAVEVTLLDGQAVFPQYVVRVGGSQTPIERAPAALGGEMLGRCRNDPQFCVASWHADGLIVTVKLDGPRVPESEAQVRQLLFTLAPQVVANLATVAS